MLPHLRTTTSDMLMTTFKINHSKCYITACDLFPRQKRFFSSYPFFSIVQTNDNIASPIQIMAYFFQRRSLRHLAQYQVAQALKSKESRNVNVSGSSNTDFI